MRLQDNCIHTIACADSSALYRFEIIWGNVVRSMVKILLLLTKCVDVRRSNVQASKIIYNDIHAFVFHTSIVTGVYPQIGLQTCTATQHFIIQDRLQQHKSALV